MCPIVVNPPPHEQRKQVLDPEWMASLTPMTRLLIMAGITSVSANAVHFVDSNRASFFYSSSPDAKQPALRKGVRADADLVDFAVNWSSKRNTASYRPPRGQIGSLRFSSPNQGNEFVVSSDQPLPYRLTVSARESLHSSGDGARAGSMTTSKAADTSMDNEDVCVKYVATVGTFGLHRVDWFPTPEDALSLRRAIDAYCPISWLRDSEEENDSPAVVTAREGRLRSQKNSYEGESSSDEYAGESRGKRLLLYQRDQNRKIIDVPGVSESSKHYWQTQDIPRQPLQAASLSPTPFLCRWSSTCSLTKYSAFEVRAALS